MVHPPWNYMAVHIVCYRYLSSQHSGVRGGLVTVGLHLLAAGDAHNGLPARQVSDVHKGVIVAGVDVAHSEHLLSVQHLWSQLDLHLLLLGLSLTWSHGLAVEEHRKVKHTLTNG